MSISTKSPNYDVVVVGARCAGAATAMLLARQGAKVLLVDRAEEGSDTLSTHALMRGAVTQLDHWNVLPAVIAEGTPPIRRTSFIYGDATPIDIDLTPDRGSNALYAPRRTVLDRQLVLAAREAGAITRFGVSMQSLVKDSSGSVKGIVLRDSTDQYEVECELVVGADGRNSGVARQVGAALVKRGTNATRTVYGYLKGLPQNSYRWHWGNGSGGGIIPTNQGEACVFLSVARSGPHDLRSALTADGYREAIQRLLPSLADELAGAELRSHMTGFAGQTGHLRQGCGNGWALVGDAGYFKDPITAHGITDALRDAQLLADSWMVGRLDDYVALRDALSHDIFRLTDEIAALDQPVSRLSELHRSLNIAMKANQIWIAENLAPQTRTAQCRTAA